MRERESSILQHEARHSSLMLDCNLFTFFFATDSCDHSCNCVRNLFNMMSKEKGVNTLGKYAICCSHGISFTGVPINAENAAIIQH